MSDLYVCDAVGTGFSISSIPAIVVLSFYFREKLSLATGIAISGYGIGVFIFAPVANALLSEYSWKGTVLIEAGILLNCILCGMIFRPLNVTKISRKNDAEVQVESVAKQKLMKVTRAEEPRIGIKSASCPDLSFPTSSAVIRDVQCSESPKSASSQPLDQIGRACVHAMSLGNICRCMADHVDCTGTRCLTQQGLHTDKLLVDEVLMEADVRKIAVIRASNPELSQFRKHTRGVRWACSSSRSLSPTKRTDIFYAKIPDHINSRTQADCDNVHSTVSHEIQQQRQGGLATDNSKNKTQRTTTKIMDFRLLLDVVFILFIISNFFTGFGYIIPFVFLPNRGRVLGFDSSQSSWLVSMLGISNIIGRVVTGLIANLKCVNKLAFYNTARVIWGISSPLSVLLLTFPLQMCYSFVFGFINGTYK